MIIDFQKIASIFSSLITDQDVSFDSKKNIIISTLEEIERIKERERSIKTGEYSLTLLELMTDVRCDQEQQVKSLDAKQEIVNTFIDKEADKNIEPNAREALSRLLSHLGGGVLATRTGMTATVIHGIISGTRDPVSSDKIFDLYNQYFP